MANRKRDARNQHNQVVYGRLAQKLRDISMMHVLDFSCIALYFVVLLYFIIYDFQMTDRKG